MKPAYQGELLSGPHVYVKRADGSSGYEPAAPVVSPADLEAKMNAVTGIFEIRKPSAADLDAVAEEIVVREATNGGTE